ncbi:MAG: hypothetical protein RIC55_09440 [Pirellulaceae bacterium]
MQSEVYRYEFADDVSMEEIEAQMVLALLGAEFLHGEIDDQARARNDRAAHL